MPDTLAPPPPRPRTRTAPDDVAANLGLQQNLELHKKRGRRWIWWAVAIVAVASVGAYVALHREKSTVRYQTVAAKRGDLSVTVTATGTLAALDTVDVGTEVSGVVDVVSADYNDKVAKGQTLAVVNTDQLQAQIRQGEANLKAAEAAAQQTAATVVETTLQAARAESLFANRAMDRQEVESARASLARAVAADVSAQAQIAASTASLQAQRTLLGKATIRSPIAGVVLQRQVEPGRTVAASFQTPVLFVLAADLKRMTLALDIDEADVGSVQDGQEATFTVDAYPERTFSARVREVRNAAKTVAGVVTYQAILEVSNPDLALRPGMTATALIATAQVRDALLVPNSALRFTPSTDTSLAARPVASAARGTNARRVWTLRDGAPTAIALSTGLSDGQWTEVTAGEVQPGLALLTGTLEGVAGASTGAAAPPSSSAESTARRRSSGPIPSPRVR